MNDRNYVNFCIIYQHKGNSSKLLTGTCGRTDGSGDLPVPSLWKSATVSLDSFYTGQHLQLKTTYCIYWQQWCTCSNWAYRLAVSADWLVSHFITNNLPTATFSMFFIYRLHPESHTEADYKLIVLRQQGTQCGSLSPFFGNLRRCCQKLFNSVRTFIRKRARLHLHHLTLMTVLAQLAD